MESSPYELITAGFPHLWWAIGFYFSSVGLVLMALVPTTCRIVAIVADRKILDMLFTFALEALVVVSRILFLGLVLVFGGAMQRADLFSIEGWINVLGTLGASVLMDPARIVVQIMSMFILLFGLYFLVSFLFNEQRMAELLDRMQRKATPWKVRRIVLVAIFNLLVLPIFIVFAVQITELI